LNHHILRKEAAFTVVSTHGAIRSAAPTIPHGGIHIIAPTNTHGAIRSIAPPNSHGAIHSVAPTNTHGAIRSVAPKTVAMDVTQSPGANHLGLGKPGKSRGPKDRGFIPARRL